MAKKQKKRTVAKKQKKRTWRDALNELFDKMANS